MPSSITTYHTFAAGTKARASQVNTNFSNYRGDILPINEDTASSSNSTHDLGKDDHRWRTVFTDEINFTTSTSTASLVLKGATTDTTGAFLFQVEGVNIFEVRSSGIYNSAYSTVALTPRRLQRKIITTSGATGTVQMPSDCTHAIVQMCGGGGGGAGGGGITAGTTTAGKGGVGGYGAPILKLNISFTASQTATYYVGLGASGGANTVSAGGSAGKNGGDSYLQIGSFYAYASGGNGGIGATTTRGSTDANIIYEGYSSRGGAGGSAGNSGAAGEISVMYGLSAAAGGGSSGGGADDGGGGGGGGSGFGPGGAGGLGRNSGSGAGAGGTGTAPTTTAYGAAGGGGGGANGLTGDGGAGASGTSGVIMIYCVTAEAWEGTI